MTKPYRLSLAAVALSAAATGCDDPASSGDLIGDVQAEEIAAIIVSNGFIAFGETGLYAHTSATLTSPGGDPYTFTVTLDDTGTCELEGTYALDGLVTVSGDDATGELSIALDYALDLTDCVAPGVEGSVFALNTSPTISVQGTVEGTETAASGNVTHTGEVHWASGGSGSCVLDLTSTYHLTVDGGSTSATADISGSVCGIPLARTIQATLRATHPPS